MRTSKRTAFSLPTVCPLLLILCASFLPSAAQADPPRGPFSPTVIPDTGPKPPWRRRWRVGVRGMNGKGQGLVDLKQWPAEPASPAAPDEQRFAAALRTLCADWMPRRRRSRGSR